MNTIDQRPLVSVICPAYNEAANLERNLNRLDQYLRALNGYRFEIVIVNDGSSDNTGDIAEAFAAGRDDVRVYHHQFNFRLGQVLRTAFHGSHGAIVVVIDADLSYAPEHIGRLIEKMKTSRAKIVIASPYAKGGRTVAIPFFRRFLSRLANWFLCRMATHDFFSDKLTNITGMVRAYDGPFIRSLSLWAMDVDINPEIINKAKILRARIVEIPAVLDWTEQTGRGARPRRRVSNVRLMRSVIQSLVSGFLFRPFLFYIIPGFILFFLSLYPLFWAVRHTFKFYASLAPKGLSFGFRLSEAVGQAFQFAPHAFIVGGIVLMVAIQMISLGLLALQKKRYFAELFYLANITYRDCTKGDSDRIQLPTPLRKI
ncbi:MAG: glycosyltransferase family 2 protein [Candidatus Aminicenantes bacterium]|nr:glycosyltransferase family 2 protein [Candidatus Aminicenantes bacterium]